MHNGNWGTRSKTSPLPEAGQTSNKLIAASNKTGEGHKCYNQVNIICFKRSSRNYFTLNNFTSGNHLLGQFLHYKSAHLDIQRPNIKMPHIFSLAVLTFFFFVTIDDYQNFASLVYHTDTCACVEK